MASSTEKAKIPVTILTGFLGSGKTTFVNYVLKEHHGHRLAIIENEFGEVGVDDGLLLVQTREEVIEMMNGCICCTVRDDLREALKRLAREQGDRFDAVIIETTGLADPAPVAQTFFVDDDIAKLYTLDAIITFIDAKHTMGHLEEVKPEGVENEAVEQVAFADVLVINKVDLASGEELAALKSKLLQINSNAKLLESTHSRVPLAEVLNIGAFDLARTLQMDDQFLIDQEHQHDITVSSVGICLEGEFVPAQFEKWLMALLREKGVDIFRSKGIMCMLGSPERYVFHGVHMLLNMGSSSELGLPLPNWGPEEKKLNKLCFIGRNLDRKALADGLQACVFNGKYPEPGEPPKKKLRFKMGDRVKANVGTWTPGRIVAVWYREPLWETGRFVPYQIQLDNGGLIYAPRDTRAFVRPIHE